MARACFYCGAEAVADDYGVPFWVPAQLGLAGQRGEHLVGAGGRPRREAKRPVDEIPYSLPSHPALGDVQPRDRLREEIEAAVEEPTAVSLADYAARTLCAACADALAALDADARPLLEGMVAGRPRRYSPEEQRLLAAWGARTAHAVLAVERKSQGVPRSHRRAVRERREPHENVFVGYGRYASEHIGVLAARLVTRLERGGNGIEAYSVLAVFGHLALKVFGLRRRAKTTLVKAPEGLMVRAWPRQGTEVEWPPVWTIRERNLEDVFLFEPFYRPLEAADFAYRGPGKRLRVRRKRTEGLGPGRG